MDKIAIAICPFAAYDLAPLNRLKDAGWAVVQNTTGRCLIEEELADLIADASGVIAGLERYTKQVLNSVRPLKAISRVGTGTDNIDLECANARGIKVLTTLDAPTQAVAEHTLALIFSVLRKIPCYDARIKQGVWTEFDGRLLADKVVGVVGLGRIGCRVASTCHSLGCRTMGYDPYIEKTAIPPFVEMTNALGECISCADILTVHIPLTPSNYHFISASCLKCVKQGAVLINTSRGGIVDEEALYQALSNGTLSGAALDVFEKEPYAGPLATLENVVLTPHIASNTVESRIQMEPEAVTNLLQVLDNVPSGKPR